MGPRADGRSWDRVAEGRRIGEEEEEGMGVDREAWTELSRGRGRRRERERHGTEAWDGGARLEGSSEGGLGLGMRRAGRTGVPEGQLLPER